MVKDLDRLPDSLRPMLREMEARLFDRGLTLQSLRRSLGIRSNRAPEQFRLALGSPPASYLAERRLETAANLLRETTAPAWQIALAVGYQGLPTFSKAFRRWSGQRPRRYRSEHTTAKPANEVTQPPARSASLDLPQIRRALAGTVETTALRPLIEQLALTYSETPLKQTLGEGFDQLLASTLKEGLLQQEASANLAEEPPFQLAHPHLFDYLSRSMAVAGRKNRHEGVRIAHLALHSVGLVRAEGSARNERLWAKAWTQLATAHRLAFHLQQAERAFQEALAHLPHLTGEEASLQRAETLGQLAGLRFDQRRLAEGLELCAQATAALDRQEEPLLRSKLACQKANILLFAGRPDEALAELTLASELLGAEEKPYLAWSIAMNQTSAYTQAGRFEQAGESLIQARSLWAGADASGDTLCQWLEARILHGKRQLEAAATGYSQAKQGFLRLEDLDRAAAVGLDLAELYLSRGEFRQVAREAKEILPVFEALGATREGFAAFRLLRTAIDRRSLSRSLLRQLGGELLGTLPPMPEPTA